MHTVRTSCMTKNLINQYVKVILGCRTMYDIMTDIVRQPCHPMSDTAINLVKSVGYVSDIVRHDALCKASALAYRSDTE